MPWLYGVAWISLTLAPSDEALKKMPVQELAIDLLYYLGDWSAALLESVVLMCSKSLFDATLISRVFDVMASRIRLGQGFSDFKHICLQLLKGSHHARLKPSASGTWDEREALQEDILTSLTASMLSLTYSPGVPVPQKLS